MKQCFFEMEFLFIFLNIFIVFLTNYTSSGKQSAAQAQDTIDDMTTEQQSNSAEQLGILALGYIMSFEPLLPCKSRVIQECVSMYL